MIPTEVREKTAAQAETAFACRGDLTPALLAGACGFGAKPRQLLETEISQVLEIQELVGDFVGCECVEQGHDPPGKVKVRGTAVGNENTRMWAVLTKGNLVQPFEVATIVGENRSLA